VKDRDLDHVVDLVHNWGPFPEGHRIGLCSDRPAIVATLGPVREDNA